MLKMVSRLLGALVAFGLVAGQVLADPVFVGSWQVDQGPFWLPAPPVYSGQEAAALLFGGSPSDYAISTIDSNPANIDNMAWVSEIFVAGGHKVAENAVQGGTNGLYDEGGDFSAYVQDNAQGSGFTNFAFLLNAAAVPEPGTLTLVGMGLMGMCGYAWRRRKLAAA